MSRTSGLTEETLLEIRALLDASFDDFSDHDWQHALGGLHAVARDGDLLMAHASMVERTIRVADADLRCGYVEAVAVRADRRREGLGGQVMAALERAGDDDALFLCASSAAVPFYLDRGWRVWRGRSFVLTPEGPAATPDEDGAILVWRDDLDLDLDAPIACDWRDGDVW